MRNWAALRPSACLRQGNTKFEIRKAIAGSGIFPVSHFRSPVSAFTLFEVLIALGVFAIAVTGLVVALDLSLIHI